MNSKKGIERHHDTGRVHQLVIPYQEGVTPDNDYDLLYKAISSAFLFAKNGIQFYSMDYYISMGTVLCPFPYTTDGITNPFTLFVDKNIPSVIDLRPERVGEKRVDLDDFSVDNLCQKALELLNSEIEQNENEELIPVWGEIYFRGMTIPFPASYAEDGSIPLIYGSWTERYPIKQDGDFVLAHGPLEIRAPYPPIRIGIQHDGGVFTLNIYTRWSYFWDETFEGYHLIQDYIKELKKEGWVEVEEEE
jgi:hypothetical protein